MLRLGVERRRRPGRWDAGRGGLGKIFDLFDMAIVHFGGFWDVIT
jgi:hypothetical protein